MARRNFNLKAENLCISIWLLFFEAQIFATTTTESFLKKATKKCKNDPVNNVKNDRKGVMRSNKYVIIISEISKVSWVFGFASSFKFPYKPLNKSTFHHLQIAIVVTLTFNCQESSYMVKKAFQSSANPS